MNQGGDGNESNACPVEPAGPWLERRSELRTLSRTVQNFWKTELHDDEALSRSHHPRPS
jgi:hypothetical protein